ncbi:MAG: hypothetical protein GX817_04360, partial [Elusimicrobia bacterium]|nr:hypothetical protein [Elusimicrobiota bacterium]
HELVNPPSAEAVSKEIFFILKQTYKDEDFSFLENAFKDFIRLFNGDYPGYCKCDTPYHDIMHSAEVFLAAGRLLDGYNIANPDEIIPFRKAEILFISALFHDSGFISKEEDPKEKGARNLVNHEERGKEFTANYLKAERFSRKEIALSGKLIETTDLFTTISDLKFASEIDRILGNILGTADLAGQMAARTYLERLQYLYEEFLDAGLPVYSSEFDLVSRTGDFYENTVKIRLIDDFQNAINYAQIHFKARSGIDENIYITSIENQLKYLRDSVCNAPDTFKEKFRRLDNRNPK